MSDSTDRGRDAEPAVVLLHHRGLRTRVARVSPVLAVRPSPDTWLIAASMGGAPTRPEWFHNLGERPDTAIETPDGRVAVHARMLEDDERDAAWPLFTAHDDSERTAPEHADPTIPIVELTRR